jgi:hypothetical protein
MNGEEAEKEVPSNNMNDVWLRVAEKTADWKFKSLPNCRLGRGFPLPSCSCPGPKPPKRTVWVEPSWLVTIRLAFIKVNGSVIGRSGGEAKIPVPFDMLKALIPGVPGADGTNTSNESTPSAIVSAWAIPPQKQKVRNTAIQSTAQGAFISSPVHVSDVPMLQIVGGGLFWMPIGSHVK